MYNIGNWWEPVTVDETLAVLKDNPQARLIAGGTDLIIKMHGGQIEETDCISLHRVDELKSLEARDDGGLWIGSMVAFSRIAKDSLVEERFPVLGQAARSMGGPQIRNMATLGGNVCNGAVSADGAPALFAADAVLLLRTAGGERRVPIGEFYLGPSKVDLKPDELLIGFEIPSHEGYGGEHIKFSPRKAMDISMLGCAALCALEPDGRVRDLKIALGTSAPTPIRCPQAEALAPGQILTEELLDRVGQAALAEASPRNSWRAAREYRKIMIDELVKRAVRTAWHRAGGESDENDSM